MPYEKRKNGSEWCVYNKNTGEKRGCSDSEEKADKHMAALYANEKALAMTDFKKSTMIGFFLPEEIATYIGQLVKDRFAGFATEEDAFELVDPKDYHITCIYLGESLDSDWMEKTRNTLAMRSGFSGPYSGKIGGAGYFNNPESFAIYLSFDSTELCWFREDLIKYLNENGVYVYSDHAYVPHITIAYSKQPVSALPVFPQMPVYLKTISLATGDNRETYELGQVKSVSEVQLESEMMKAAYYDNAGNLIVPVIGVPYKGPVRGNKDFVGDHFDKNSKIDLVSDEIEADFDHGRDNDWLPADLKNKGFGSGAIGRAKQIGEYEEDGISGKLFHVIVDRHHKYIKLIKKLTDLGHIHASMKMSRRVNGDTDKGYIQEATISKMSLTPSPMNPMALSLYKSMILDIVGEGEMNEDENKKEGTEEGEKSALSLADEINSLFDGAQGDNEKSLRTVLETISTDLKKVIERQNSFEARMGSIKDADGTEKSLSDEVIDLRSAFKVLADRTVKAIQQGVKGEFEKSADQREGEKKADDKIKGQVKPIQKIGVIPDTAPGKAKVS